MTETESITVLHVDDDRQFFEASVPLLEREDASITVVTATAPERGLEVLECEPVDCVVSDYQMPDTTGLAFLEAVRDRHGDLPFILFTGRGSEEIASDAISAGVTDYLQKGGKDRYPVLANRIRNAIERRRAEERVRRAYQAIETAREGIGILDHNGRFTYVNQAYCDIYGYECDDLLGEHWSILYPRDEIDTIVSEVFPQMEAEGIWRGETVGVRADGSTFSEDHSLAMTESGGFIGAVRVAEAADVAEHVDAPE